MAKCHNEDRENKATGLFIFLFLLPLIIRAIVFSRLARMLAKSGAPWPVVRTCALRATFVITNLAGVMLLVATSLVVGLFDREVGTYLFAHVADFTALPLWAPIVSWFHQMQGADFARTIPAWQVLLYQAVLWLILGKWIGRSWTALMYW